MQDVFAEPGLREWWEPARELGFTSLISLPLEQQGQVRGALTFYFAEAHRFAENERALLTAITEQLAATAERAHLMERLQTDNTRLERENAQLTARARDAEQARRLKNEFLLNVSHELQEPLESIRACADRLADDPAGRLSGQQRAAVEKIDHSAALMRQLVGNLLDLSRVKLGKVTPQESACEAASLGRQAAEAAGAAPDGVAFRMLTPDGSVPLTVDGAKVVTIVGNLLSNAFKYTSHGEVVLTVRRTPMITPGEDGRRAIVEWEVRDTGIGIRPEEQPWIFDELRQVDGSSTRLYGGTGLGLALSRALAHVLGGDIALDSEQGRGSTFTLRVPARVE